MKVLEPGKRPKWSIERKCTECGAKLLVDFDDLSKTYNTCYDETTEFVGFDCGHCGVRNDLPKSKLPKNEEEIPSKADWERSQKIRTSTSSVLCEHANESPRNRPCACDSTCYCKAYGSCRKERT